VSDSRKEAPRRSIPGTPRSSHGCSGRSRSWGSAWWWRCRRHREAEFAHATKTCRKRSDLPAKHQSHERLRTPAAKGKEASTECRSNVKGFFRHPAGRTHCACVAHSAAGWRKGPVGLNRCRRSWHSASYLARISIYRGFIAARQSCGDTSHAVSDGLVAKPGARCKHQVTVAPT
jgi:hypothetical protein